MTSKWPHIFAKICFLGNMKQTVHFRGAYREQLRFYFYVKYQY